MSRSEIAIVSCLTSCYGRFGAVAAIERVREAGLEHIELPIRTDGHASRAGDAPLLTELSDEAAITRVERLLADNGVRLASVNAISGNPLRPGVVEVLLRKMELAARLGVAKVVTEAGGHETDEERGLLLENLRRVGDRAAQLGQTICFETHRGVCVNHREMIQLMKDLDHPALRLNFDTANLLYYNTDTFVEIALAKSCHLVKSLHLKDSMGEFGQWYFPALGSGGAVDFLRVLQIMRGVGFRGPYTIEIGGIEGEGELSLDEYHARVVESVRYLRGLGYFDVQRI
jgi:L-ribulose-5-phosphate 3-epimerase